MPRPIQGEHKGLPPILIPQNLLSKSDLTKGTILTARVMSRPNLPDPFHHYFEASSLFSKGGEVSGFVYHDDRYSGSKPDVEGHGDYRVIIISDEPARFSNGLAIEGVILRTATENRDVPHILQPEQGLWLIRSALRYTSREVQIDNSAAQRDYEQLNRIDSATLGELFNSIRVPKRRPSNLPEAEYRRQIKDFEIARKLLRDKE